MLQPIERQSVADQVFQQLRDRILSGDMGPGAALPSERRLSELLGVNRGAVREGLKRLAQARLVDIQQGGATRVLDFRQTGGLDLLGALLVGPRGLDTHVARSVMEMRTALAPHIAELAAGRAQPRHLAELDAIGDQMAASGGDQGQLQQLADRYWGVLVDASQNLAFRLAYNTLSVTHLALGPLVAGLLAEEHADTPTYRSITDAVRRGDTIRARRLADELIRRGERAVCALLDRLETQA